MGKNCCVLGCSSSSTVPTHHFPKKERMFEKWKKSVMSSKIAHLTDDELKKSVVCYKHFKNDDYDSSYRYRRLKPDTIPSLEILSDIVEYSGSDNETGEMPVLSNEVDSGLLASTTDVMEIDGDAELRNLHVLHFDNEIEIGVPQSSSQCRENEDAEELGHVNLPNSISNEQVIIPKKKRTYLLGNRINQSKLSAREKRLYLIAMKFKRQQMAATSKYKITKERLKEYKKFSKSWSIEKLLDSLTPMQRNFMNMQLRKSSYSPKGMRFSLDEKILALSLWKQSTKAYIFLRQIFHLPSTRTLRTLLQNVKIHPGPIKLINNHIKEQAKNMQTSEKFCILMWDEIQLSRHLDFDKMRNEIVGFEDFGIYKKAVLADHALLFMIRGINSGWKMPVCYYFCDNMTKSDTLVECIETVTKSIINCGLNIVGFLCDQANTNIAAINKLKTKTILLHMTDGKYDGNIMIEGKKIIPFYDPPHLIKSVRNNLLTKHLELNYKMKDSSNTREIAKWDIIHLAYNIDADNCIHRLMPKITKEHIEKKKINKMRVKHAVQTLSKTMGNFILHHTRITGTIDTKFGPVAIPKKEGKDTSNAIFFFNDLFDSVNGHTTLDRNSPLRCVVSSRSQHISFWKRASKQLYNMRFCNKGDLSPINVTPCLKNWSITIKSFITLWKLLKEKGFKSFTPRYINQDPLENFFGQIRSFGHRNINPTCAQFEMSFKALLINNLTSRKTFGNCEDMCNGDLLFSLKSLITNTSMREIAQITNTEAETDFIDIKVESDLFFQNEMSINNYSSEIGSGFSKIIQIISNLNYVKDCDTCLSMLTSTDKSLIVIYGQINDILSKNIQYTCYIKNIIMYLETILHVHLDFSCIHCEKHRSIIIDKLLDLSVISFINKWCGDVNAILHGKINNTKNDIIMKMAKEKYLKTIKRKKKDVETIKIE
ncbi:uncharacterized protein [Prorops nasuta]|uniref:uncharacterized protein n=1 Tax=Prorops nasuta TaxID=863751 RepID=UPI0034CD914F